MKGRGHDRPGIPIAQKEQSPSENPSWGVGSQMRTSRGFPAAGLLPIPQSKPTVSVLTWADLAASLTKVTSKHLPAFFHISSVT